MTVQDSIKVLCVDDSPGILRLLAKIVDREPDMHTVGWLDRADGLSQAVERLAPDVVLLDLTMPGRNPLDALRELAGGCHAPPVIVFSGHDDPDLIDTAMASGARGFLVKDGSIDPVLTTIRRVAAGEVCRKTA